MNKTVLITGASRGIGRGIAEVFADRGFGVAVNYFQNRQAAQALCETLGARGCHAVALRADVADGKQVDDMVDAAYREFGGIGVLVNNAGVAQQKLFTDISAQDWQRMFDVNVKGVFHCCQRVLPGMIARKSGKIINVSSVWGITGASCEVHYSAAKAAVIGLTKALAKELGPSGIQVNCVAPGVIDTDMNAGLNAQALAALKDDTPLGVIGTARDVAEAVYFLASDKADFITGQVFGVNGGFLI